MLLRLGFPDELTKMHLFFLGFSLLSFTVIIRPFPYDQI